jgi:isopenicillin-N epimerase
MLQMREHWSLDPGLTFLNHGSFGACPRAVLDHQATLRAKLEASPVQFMLQVPTELERLRVAVAPFVGADPQDLAFVRNATEGVNAVLRSLSFGPGDELLTSNHVYPGCLNALRFIAQQSGASVRMVEVPFPIDSPEQVVEAFRSGITPRTRLALVDHVTSVTGLVFPVASIAQLLRSRGVACLVDGAHAAGMLDLNIAAVGADYYATNFHKWACAPKGAGILWVRSELHDQIHPSVVSHGYSEPAPRRFQAMFDWTGTSDPTAWMSIAKALNFMGSLLRGGWPALREENRRLALHARDLLCKALDVSPPAPDAMIGSMASIPLPAAIDPPPSGPDPLYLELVRRGFETLIQPFPTRPARVLRVSAQLYNDVEDYERLARVLPALL